MKAQITTLFLLTAGLAMAQGNSGNQQAPSAAEFISKLDKDGDGKVSQTEFDGPAEHFTQLDADSDGYISESEVPSGPPQRQNQSETSTQQTQQTQQRGQRGESDSDGASFVTRLDKDGDGKVSSSEFDGPAEIFTELDKNSDGYLSADEAPSGPPPGGRR